MSMLDLIKLLSRYFLYEGYDLCFRIVLATFFLYQVTMIFDHCADFYNFCQSAMHGKKPLMALGTYCMSKKYLKLYRVLKPAQICNT